MLMIVNGMTTHNHFCICLPFSVSENLYGLENNHFTIFTFAEPLLSQGLFSCLIPNTLSPPFKLYNNLFSCFNINPFLPETY